MSQSQGTRLSTQDYPTHSVESWKSLTEVKAEVAGWGKIGLNHKKTPGMH